MEQKIFKGSELQFLDQGVWRTCTYDQYRIKPKTVKFRNYLNKAGNIRTCNDGESQSLFVKWIGDWQEVEVDSEPDQQWPTELVARIANIDLQAAEWLRDNWSELDSKNYQEYISVGKNSDNLSTMFNWRNSPQGSDYWDNIRSKLGR